LRVCFFVADAQWHVKDAAGVWVLQALLFSMKASCSIFHQSGFEISYDEDRVQIKFRESKPNLATRRAKSEGCDPIA
jgi:hypothetical protein